MHVEGVLANNDYILNGCYIEITSNCNLRCIHCYNESGELRDQISVEAFKNVLGCYDNPKKASITLSGGEPLLHPQVWKFIDMMLESGILARNILLITNATCITDDVANMLAEKHVSVQVSLNGSRAELHDSICGKGNFERTMAGLQRLLSKHANMVIVRNMMNKQNMNDNWDMFCEKLIDMGVHKIMLAGLKKVGRANENLEKIALTPLEYQSLIDRLKESKVITGINDEYRKLAGDEAESNIRIDFFFSKMIDVKEKITLEYKRLCQKNTFQRTIATVTQSMAMAMALLLTGYLVIKKKTPIGAFVLVYNTGRNLQSAVSSFVGTISTWDQFGINFADWNRLMNLEEEPEGDEDCIDKIHEIEMKNVEFRYPQRSESAVKNINLRILTGEKIAIVGENGSGKTTLLYLLLGIYRPISGEASVNGKTMELNLDNYRKKTACLIQNFVHFQMTLRENLAPNDFSELSEDPLIDFANNFPDRLNTFLGALDSNGVELSGGQWKRIALYRTLHKKDVDLIVLDEPTANLDPKISENIINRLLKPNYNKTVIVITHDFELAKKFDRIIGMKEGKIICDSPPQAFAWELFEKHNSDKRSLPQIG